MMDVIICVLLLNLISCLVKQTVFVNTWESQIVLIAWCCIFMVDGYRRSSRRSEMLVFFLETLSICLNWYLKGFLFTFP